MTKIARLILLAVFYGAFLLRADAESVRTLDLKAHSGKSSVENQVADSPLPRGQQVLDGVPFEINGAVLFYATNSLQKDRHGITNLTNLEIGQKFELLHLLAGTDLGGDDNAAVAKIHFQYADGSESALDLVFGEQLLCWQAAWHKEEASLKNLDVHVAWRGQASFAAQSDKYLRLFHVALTNPSPEREVRAISIDSAKTQHGLLLVGVSFGPANAEKLPDTISAAHNPFPDLRPRSGEKSQGEGFIKGRDGRLIAGARVRIAAVRDVNTEDNTSITKDPAVGLGAETDAQGHFILPPLPDNHLYRIQASADSHQLFTYRGLDPKSDPIEIHLKPLNKYSSNPKFVLRARLVGPDGKPIPFAVVEHDGVGSGGGTSWGGPAGFPDEIIANASGEFVFGRDEPFDRLQIKASSADLAPLHIWVDVSNSLQTIQMVPGAVIRGRVLDQSGKPLTNMSIGISGHDRNSEVWAGNYGTKTSTNGEFIFEHVPTNTSWDLYGVISSFKPYGALPPRLVQSGNNRETLDLGDVKVVAAIHLAGKIRTRNGDPLPNGLKVRVSYNDAWDSEVVNAEKDGTFRMDGLARKQVEVSIDNRNWRLSRVNRSLDTWNPWWLTGLLEENKDDLVMEIEKGQALYNGGGGSGNGQLPTADQPQSRPLWGVEDSGPPFIYLAGHVLDDASGQPVMNFKVTPGHKPPMTALARPQQKSLAAKVLQPLAGKKNQIPWNERIFWQYSHQDNVSNGFFSVPFIPMTSQPVLRIEAAGYEPFETDPTNSLSTNLIVRLKKGVGPYGIVLLPGGAPAKNASVAFGISQEQFSLDGSGIANYGQTNALFVTREDGKFSFAPRTEASTIFVAHPAGWAQHSLDRGGENLTLELRPWAALSGTLVDSNNTPQTNVALALTMFHDWQHGSAMINLQHRVTTDAQGRFTFTNVPPSRVEIQRMIPMTFAGASRSSYSYQMQTWTIPQPGITNDLGKVTLDHPPPEPMLDQIKQKLGL